MFTPPTYLGFLVVVLLPPIAVLAVLTRDQRNRAVSAGTAVVAVIGLLYTAPWDNALIAHGVWEYGEGVVLARLHLAPVEEYLFIAFQPVLTGLWVAFLRARAGASPPGDWTTVSRRARLAGVLGGLGVGGCGLALLTADATLYAGAILAWAGPVLAVQWAFGWPHLWRRRRLAALSVLGPTLYLAAADRVAIELGIWQISPVYTTGLTVAGLPVEEGAFFLVTNLFVVQGLLLYLWVVDGPTEAEAPATTPVAPNP